MSRRALHHLMVFCSAGRFLPLQRPTLLSAEDASLPLQPFAAAVRRVISALDAIGTPLSAAEKSVLDHAVISPVSAPAVKQIQQVLAPHWSQKINASGRQNLPSQKKPTTMPAPSMSRYSLKQQRSSSNHIRVRLSVHSDNPVRLISSAVDQGTRAMSCI